jgi:hypothetical protein
MAKIVNAHVKEYGQQISTGVPVEEASGADFKAGDFVKVTTGRINKFVDTTPANAVQLCVVNSDSKLYWKGEQKSWWPSGRGHQGERGHITYSVTKDSVMVMSLAGSAPADIQTLIGQKREIAYDATAKTILVQAGTTNTRVQIIGILEGANNELNPVLLVKPLLDADNWFNAS